MSADELDAHHLISEGYLERIEDLTYEGRKVEASRLGYRITERFVHTYFGRVFDHPDAVFDDAMLRPETQDLGEFIDGVENIVEAQRRVAQGYFDDGAIDEACPPLQALLHIMAKGQYRGMDIKAPELRQLFTREYVLNSDWYRERLLTKQQRDIDLWERHIKALNAFLRRPSHEDEAQRLGIRERLQRCEQNLRTMRGLKYLQGLAGTIGADPLGEGSSEGLTGHFARAERS